MSDIATVICGVCALAAVIVAGVELVALQRHRRLLLHDRPRRRFFVRSVQGGAQLPTASAVHATSQPPPMRAAAETATTTSHNGGNGDRIAGSRSNVPQDGIVYIDADGRCTFINQAARALLQWDDSHLSLSDVLAGGVSESAALVEALKRQGLVEQHLTSLAAATSTALELSAVALRDRDDNLWGAAVFIHKPSAPSSPSGDSQS